MYIRDIIDKKRKRKELTENELRFYIFSYFKGEISEAQASALMTAMHIYGLSENEMKYMINAISETGEELEFYRLSNRITDIHSLGGISDKIILILISVINALGYESCKVIGRELGMEDRLISIKKYQLVEDINLFKKQLSDYNISILKSIKNLAPIENKLYKLRHEIACDNNMQLIAISIMSQKVALGFKNIFFEITYGKNAYVKTLSDAKRLAKYLINIGNSVMRNVGVGITKLNQPIGKTFGNILELKEIYDSLNGSMPKDIEETVLQFGNVILKISGINSDKNVNIERIKDVIINGKALESFKELIRINGGDIKILEKGVEVKNIVPVISKTTGYISEIDINKLRTLSKYLCSIRSKETDKIDIGAGVVLNRKNGDAINKGEILCYIYTNNETKIKQATLQAQEMFEITEKIRLNSKKNNNRDLIIYN